MFLHSGTVAKSILGSVCFFSWLKGWLQPAGLFLKRGLLGEDHPAGPALSQPSQSLSQELEMGFLRPGPGTGQRKSGVGEADAVNPRAAPTRPKGRKSFGYSRATILCSIELPG